MKGKDGTRFSWDFLGLKLHVFFFFGGGGGGHFSPASLTEWCFERSPRPAQVSRNKVFGR